MMHEARGKWHGVVVTVLVLLLCAGCAGMQPAGGGEAPQGPGQPAAMQDLPPSTVEMKVEEAPPPEPAPPESLVHRVGFEGETLSLIAKWYTGSLNNWRELAAANPEIDPNRIFIGNEIVIPAELLVTREPMPRSFIRGK